MGKHRDEPSDNFLCIPTHETSIQKHVHNYKCILMRLKLQADNHKRVQTTTITCIHKHTHVTHGNTFANTTFAKHPRYIVHMLKKRGNEFWWLRKLGVQGCRTKRLWQCNLRMVPLMGISGFFFAITRNAMSAHIQSSTSDRKGRRNFCDNVNGMFGGVAPRGAVGVFSEWSCLMAF